MEVLLLIFAGLGVLSILKFFFGKSNEDGFASKKAKQHYDAALKHAEDASKIADDYFKETGRKNPFEHLKSKK